MRRVTSRTLRVVVAVTIAASLPACAWWDLLSPPKPEFDPVWDPIGRVEQRWYVQLPAADPWELKPDPLWTTHGVIVPASDGYVVALDAQTGARRWTARLDDGLSGARPVLSDGVIVVAKNYGAAGLDAATGTVRWGFETPEDERVSATNGSPGDHAFTAGAYLGADGTAAYLPAWGGLVSAIDLATGAQRWLWRDTLRIANPAGATGAVVSGDTIYVHAFVMRERGPADSEVWIVALRRSDGAELWRRRLPEDGYGWFASTPVVFNNLLIVRQHERVVALNRFTTDVAWTFRDASNVLAQNNTVTLSDGRLYLGLWNATGVDDGTIVALDAATGQVIWRELTYNAPNRDIVASPTRLYSTNGYFMIAQDRASGRMLVRIRSPGGDACGFLSAPTVGDGQVYVRVGCTSGRRNAWVYTDYVWSFAEP
jgi:eukaryotic-like serine/threonine-protein kinase